MMSEDSETKKTTEETPPKTAFFVDFETRQEDWNLYRIVKDGTLLRGKVVLTGFMMKDKLEEMVKKIEPEKGPDFGLVFRSKNIFAVESPRELWGKPDKANYGTAKLRTFIVDADMDFQTVRGVWNIYALKNGITVKIRLLPVNVHKTSKFDSYGMPVYVVDANLDVKIDLPDYIGKAINERIKAKPQKPQ